MCFNNSNVFGSDNLKDSSREPILEDKTDSTIITNNSYNIKVLGKTELLEIFNVLNSKLSDNKLSLSLTIYGGTVMNLLYDVRPATKDIDCVFSNTDFKLLDSIIKDIAFVYSLGDNWINDDIKVPLESLMKEDLSIFNRYSNLDIQIPSRKQLLAMKVLSARPEPSKDFIDAYLLCKDLGVKTKEELLNIFSEFIPKNLIGERQIQFIKYLGDDLGYDWK